MAEEDALAPSPDFSEEPVEGPAAPGSADEFINDVNAGPPVAAPGSPELPDVDETLAAPTPAPDVVPGVPNPPPGAPPPVPGAPPGPVPAPGAPVPAPSSAVTPEKVIGEQQKLEEATAAIKERQAREESTAARQEAADFAAERQAQADERARVQAEIDARRQAAQADLDKKTAFYEKNHELRDPRLNQTTWDKVRDGIALAFGGLGAAFSAAGGGSNKNLVLEQMTNRLERETARQKANIENARDDVVQARANLSTVNTEGRQQIADADDARRILIQDEDARHVARLRVAEAQGRAELEAQGMNAAQINADTRIVQLQQARIAAERTAQNDAAKRADEAARAEYYRARAGQAIRKGRGGGGAGTSALEAMQAAANQPGATVLDVAIAGRKAHLSEKEALKQANTVWANRSKDTGAGQRETRQLDREVKDWATTNGIPKAIAARDQLETIKEKLADPKVDPATVMSSLMEFDKAVKGGTATKTSLDAFLGHLGGLKERVEGWLAKGETGNLAPDQIGIIRKAIDAAVKASDAEGKRHAQSFDERFRNSKDPSISAQRDSLFRRFGIKSGGGKPSVPDAVIEQAKAEVKRKGPHAASAQKLLDQQGITVL